MTFRKYPEYKDSGVEWLGEVPAHWEVYRLKHSVESCRNGIWGQEPTGDSNDLPCVRVADFDRARLRVVLDDPTLRNVKPGERKGRVLKRGNLVLEKSGGGENQPVGFVVLYDDDRDAVCSNFTAKMALADRMDASFWRYVHAAAYAIRLNFPSIKQTSGIQNLDQQSYLDERAAYPPNDEQSRIAAFLDHETTRIDALVEEQKRLIELLKEKRQAVISHAVTKGLDPDVPMKDSGVEWLGEVPKHWDIFPAKFLFHFVTSGSRGWAEYYSDSGNIFFRITNLSKDSIQPKLNSIQYVSPPDDSEGSRAKIKSGDILVSITADLGSVCAANEDVKGGYVSQHVALARPNQEVRSSEWLAYFILGDAAKEQLLGSGYGGTKVQLSLKDVGELVVAVPPKNEQVAISEELTSRLSEMDTLADEATHAAELLSERRSALISAAVTGKIDVRNWATHANAEPESYAMAAEPKAAYETNSS